MSIETYLRESGRKKTFTLVPKSWRVFVNGASIKPEEPCSIELVCKWKRAALEDRFRLGKLREEMDDIPISVTIERASDGFVEALKSDNERRKKAEEDTSRETDFAGLLTYYEPVNTADGVVRDKTGSVNCFFGVDPESFDFIRSTITRSDPPDYLIALTIRFPTDKQKQEWDGKEAVDVVKGWMVIASEDEDEDEEKDKVSIFHQDSTDPAALQLAASKDIAAKLDRLRITLICLTAVIVLALAVLH